MRKTDKFWRICYWTAIIVAFLSYTPVVIPNGKFRPELFGMPYTLWMGFVFYFLLVLLTLWGTKVYPDHDEEDEV